MSDDLTAKDVEKLLPRLNERGRERAKDLANLIMVQVITLAEAKRIITGPEYLEE